MRLPKRFHRPVATLAVVLGAGVFGVSIAGIASVDAELRASTEQVAPPARGSSEVVVVRSDCPKENRGAARQIAL